MPSSNSTQKNFLSFLGLVGKGCPLPIMCHPERSEGVSNLIEGVGHHPLKTPPRKHENRRSLTKGVRDDTSCRFWKGSVSPFDWRGDVSLRSTWPHDVTPRSASDEGSPPFNRGGLLHPKNINGGDPSLRSGWLGGVSPRADFARGLQYSRRENALPRTPPKTNKEERPVIMLLSYVLKNFWKF